MAEVFGTEGDPVLESGTYACSECGHREHFERGQVFPADHHPGHPWTLMVRDRSPRAADEMATAGHTTNRDEIRNVASYFSRLHSLVAKCHGPDSRW
ncbi:MAG: hypothetical protein ACXVAR_11625 [Vulcanimicrobiaceae bacterium]